MSFLSVGCVYAEEEYRCRATLINLQRETHSADWDMRKQIDLLNAAQPRRVVAHHQFFSFYILIFPLNVFCYVCLYKTALQGGKYFHALPVSCYGIMIEIVKNVLA